MNKHLILDLDSFALRHLKLLRKHAMKYPSTSSKVNVSMPANLNQSKLVKLIWLRRLIVPDSSSTSKLVLQWRTKLESCSLLNFCRVNLLIFFSTIWTLWRKAWEARDLHKDNSRPSISSKGMQVLSNSNKSNRCRSMDSKFIQHSKDNRFLLPRCNKTTTWFMDSQISKYLSASSSLRWCSRTSTLVCLSLPWILTKLPSTSLCKSINCSSQVWLTLLNSRMLKSVTDASSLVLWSLTTW